MSDQAQRVADERLELTRARLKTPRAAAVAGILFAVLFLAAFALMRVSIPDSADEMVTGNWLQGNTDTISLGLMLIPFSGIAFLWFMGVIRDRLGKLEDQFFATVFLGSGLLFLAMIFAAGAITGGILATMAVQSEALNTNGVGVFISATIYTIVRVYAIRMAGVFMISLGTISRTTRIMPRPFIILTYILALVMLLTVNATPWLMMIFPIWVFLISLHILYVNLRRTPASAEAAASATGA